jgi:hypothetical protein
LHTSYSYTLYQCIILQVFNSQHYFLCNYAIYGTIVYDVRIIFSLQEVLLAVRVLLYTYFGAHIIYTYTARTFCTHTPTYFLRLTRTILYTIDVLWSSHTPILHVLFAHRHLLFHLLLGESAYSYHTLLFEHKNHTKYPLH